MSPFKQILRIILVIHGFLNIAQGFYVVFSPRAWAKQAGPAFVGSSEQALQSIGLGSIGVGAYGALGAYSNDRHFYALTALMRYTFAATVLTQWDRDQNGVAIYEILVAGTAMLASVLN
ncbi:uncharacterized protein LTR77_008938 [Saxophila tyrrhenica]|uniref:DUF4345 domain-containing protein n=1 Tax=Saxophila tyrrhenica TaxID=1690608 RepID=A0AAV9P1Z9_9PEZI|nr:hypothetical protein LTR77_008938 [Saxophila tyrrhenica]